MGCSGGSAVNEYTVQFCNLLPVPNQKNSFKINLIAEEEFQKIESVKFFNQINKSNNSEIIKFIQRPTLESNTIFYYYLKEEPLIKNYSQSTKYVPFNLPLLTKIILLSTDLAQEYPIQIIENEMKRQADEEKRIQIRREKTIKLEQMEYSLCYLKKHNLIALGGKRVELYNTDFKYISSYNLIYRIQ